LVIYSYVTLSGLDWLGGCADGPVLHLAANGTIKSGGSITDLAKRNVAQGILSLVVDRFEITPDGKKSSLVWSALRSIAVKYEQDGTVFVEAEENVNALKKTMKNFFSIE